MKRLAVLVKPQNVNDIISPLKEMGLEATIYDVRGVGKEKGERVASGRGSGTSEQAYATRKVVATVVKSGDANKVVERMKKALGGEKAVVMISPVDDLVMILIVVCKYARDLNSEESAATSSNPESVVF
jgi:nitrogen regulatory protein PII